MSILSDYFQYKKFADDEEIRQYKEKLDQMAADVPIWEKKCLTIEEAAAYSGVGINILRRMVAQRGCSFVLMNGNQHLIVREKYDSYLQKQTKIKER